MSILFNLFLVFGTFFVTSFLYEIKLCNLRDEIKRLKNERDDLRGKPLTYNFLEKVVAKNGGRK